MDSSGGPVRREDKGAVSLLPRSPGHLLLLPFLPGSRQETPKFHFFCLIPVFIVLQAQGCTIQDVPQPIQVFLDASLSVLLLPCGWTSIIQTNLLFISLSNSLFPLHCTDPGSCASCSPSPIVLPPAGLSHVPLACALSWSSR